MRQIATALAWIACGAIPPALADPPGPNPTVGTAPKETSSTASPPAAAQASPAAAPSEVDPREKILLRMGFRPRMQNGQKAFCKREQELGVARGRDDALRDRRSPHDRISAVTGSHRSDAAYGTNPTGH